jgi:hypothetical protein
MASDEAAQRLCDESCLVAWRRCRLAGTAEQRRPALVRVRLVPEWYEQAHFMLLNQRRTSRLPTPIITNVAAPIPGRAWPHACKM